MIGMAIGTLAFGVAWIALFQWLYRSSVAKAETARTWPVVQGRVTSGSMIVAGGRFAVIAVYEYMVDGQAHKSNRLRFGGASALGRSEAEDLAAHYARGNVVPVYYDPRDPRQSVLQPLPPKRLMYWASWIGGVPVLLLGALFMVLAIAA